jgi:glycogen debranching enzyme
MATLADVVGDERAKVWRDLAQKVKKAINDNLWSEEKQAYLDVYNPSYIPQDGNALCLLFGVADGERAKAVMNTLKEKLWTPYGSAVISEYDAYEYGGNDVVSPTMNSHEAEARFLHGDADGALELMRRCWGSMMRKGAKTFWEYANANEESKPKWFSICHAWSAGCTYLLSAYVLGIRPLTPGYDTLLFAPCDKFDSFEGVVPTVRGLVAVKCESEGDKKKYTLAIPKGTDLETNLTENASLEIIEY